MIPLNARHRLLGLRIAAIAVCLSAYAGNSSAWAGPAEPSIPATPYIQLGSATTPVKLQILWGPSQADTLAAPPTSYDVTLDRVLQPSLPATASAQVWTYYPVVPGSSHDCTVVAYAGAFASAPATFTATAPKVLVSLGKPSVPSSAKSMRTFRVSGKVVSAYSYGRNSTVKLKFYRHQKKSGKWYWRLKKTITAKRPGSSSYSLYTRLRTKGTWSVVAWTYPTATHEGDSSRRSNSFKIK